MKINLEVIKSLELKLAEYSKENGAIAKHESANANYCYDCNNSCSGCCYGSMQSGCGTCQHECYGGCLGSCASTAHSRNERILE